MLDPLNKVCVGPVSDKLHDEMLEQNDIAVPERIMTHAPAASSPKVCVFHLNIYTHTRVHQHTRTPTHRHTQTHTHTHTCIYTHTYIDVHARTHTHIHTHIHTHLVYIA